MQDKFTITELDIQPIKDICVNCGSKSVKGGYGYISWIYYHNPGRCRLSLYPETAFWFGTVSKKHFRLIEFAVRKDKQGHGYGRLMYGELRDYVKSIGIPKITLRTSAFESAINFWESVANAKVVGVKKDDYELEIILD